MTDLDFGDLCTDGFHSDECPGCGMTIFDRDGDMLETHGAMNYGAGVEDERSRIDRAVRQEVMFTLRDGKTFVLLMQSVLEIINPKPAQIGIPKEVTE